MFSFLKRSPRRPAAAGRAAPAFAPTLVGEDYPPWNDSASELAQGAEIVEYDGDFAATVLLEHFSDHPQPHRAPR